MNISLPDLEIDDGTLVGLLLDHSKIPALIQSPRNGNEGAEGTACDSTTGSRSRFRVCPAANNPPRRAPKPSDKERRKRYPSLSDALRRITPLVEQMQEIRPHPSLLQPGESLPAHASNCRTTATYPSTVRGGSPSSWTCFAKRFTEASIDGTGEYISYETPNPLPPRSASGAKPLKRANSFNQSPAPTGFPLKAGPRFRFRLNH